MNYLSLFSGIGGLDLGLGRAGWTCVGQVEIDPFCRKVLARHWPEVPRHDDVRSCVEWWRSEPRPTVHAVVGGFPCQPVSVAGRQRAQADERWLWPAAWTVIRDLRPQWAVLENVPGLLARGMGDVLADLAEGGYDAEWDCIPAAAVGAPHRRDRVFLVAYPDSIGWLPGWYDAGSAEVPQPLDRGVLDDTGRGRRVKESATDPQTKVQAARVYDADPHDSGWWATEPDVGRVAHGVPARVDRLRVLGNAVVPQVAEHIGRMILEVAA